MSKWEETTLGDIVSLGNGIIQTGPFGSQLHASDYVKEGVPCIMPVNLNDNRVVLDSISYISHEDASRLSKHIVRENDIVYSRRGDITQKALITQKEDGFFCGTGCLLIRPGSKINSKFLLYSLGKLESISWLKNHAVGITMPNLNTKILSSIPLRIPFINYQNAIANVLGTIDNKIQLNYQVNAELDKIVKTLYNYWFVQFDFPNSKGKPYKSSGGKMVYNVVLKREIPKEWEVSLFADWVNDTKTGDWGKDKLEGNYIHRVFCVRGADINGINGKGEVKAPQRFILKNNASKTLLPNDLIIEISGGSPTQSTGRIALISNKVFERFNAPVICSNFCKAVSLKDEKYTFNFQQEWQRLYDAKIFFGFEGKTSGIKNFLFDSFINSYQVVIPPKGITEKFYDFAKLVEEKKQTNLLENQQLAALRDWLMPMLMNGQVKVMGVPSGNKN